jgi:hypothetical protein
MIVVIPTCRGVDLRYLAPLLEHGCRFIVVDDSEGTVALDDPRFEVYTWSDRRRILGRHEIAIPKGTGACRDLGFYLAWKEGDADEVVVALDDDCVVESADFLRRVQSALGGSPRPVAFGAGKHFNIFDLYADDAIRSSFPRGFPYAARRGYRAWWTKPATDVPAMLNLGLWKVFLDINAVDRAVAESAAYPDADLRIDSVVVPPGVLVSVCSGNMQFRRAVIPAIYQLPMNVEIIPGLAVNRFGDIWGGFIAKTLMDLRGDALSVGRPLVHHMRVGPVLANARHEHLGHLVNEEFIDLLGRAATDIHPAGYLDMVSDLRERFASLAAGTSPILKAYLRSLHESLGSWVAALRSSSSR